MARNAIYDFNPPLGPIAYKYEAFRDGEDFAEEAFIGMVGCVHGDTEIFDVRVGRGVKISDLYNAKESPTVLALNDEGEFIHAVSSVPFKKGKAYLYKVCLENGREITVTRLHKFLTPYGYLSLEKMVELGVSSVLSPSEYALDVRHYSGTVQDYQGDCLEYYHLYDEPLRLEIDTVQLEIPSQVYLQSQSLGSVPTVPLNSSLTEVSIQSMECQGFDWFYDIHVPVYENYVAEGIVNHNTAKSSAALDMMLRRAYEYPGSNTLIVRATLQNLKNSTLLRLEERFGGMFMEGIDGSSMNRQEGIYRFPYEPDPISGKKVQSSIRSIGVDRADIQNLLRSTEFSTVFVEEANEISTDVIDELQVRSRQKIYHRTKKVKHLCFKLASRWSITPEEVYEILRADKRHKVFQEDLQWDDPMPGDTIVKCVWNPDDDNAIWQRFVGVPYPDPYPDEEFVRRHIGIKEIHVSPEELKKHRTKFVAGVMLKLPDGTRRYVARHEDERGKVVLVPDRVNGGPSEVDDTNVGMVLQRNSIFAFTHENESRDFTNDINSFFVQNRQIAERAFLGASDKKKGRVFSNYIDEYVENGGNLIRDPGKPALAKARYMILGGIDAGGNHSHAIVMAVFTPQTNTIIIYDAIVKAGLSSLQMAHEAKPLILPGCPTVIWGHDPSMVKKLYDVNTDHRLIDNYQEELIDKYRPGDHLIPAMRGDEAYDYVNGLLVPQEIYINQKAPKILVVDSCEYVRVTMRELTWYMVNHQRHDFKVDVGDAIKYMVSMRKQQVVVNPKEYNADDIFKANLPYKG